LVNYSWFGALVQTAPERAKEHLRWAMRVGHTMDAAARLLGIERRQLYRLVYLLDDWKMVNEIRLQAQRLRHYGSDDDGQDDQETNEARRVSDRDDAG
jgi:hypothetical protein